MGGGWGRRFFARRGLHKIEPPVWFLMQTSGRTASGDHGTAHDHLLPPSLRERSDRQDKRSGTPRAEIVREAVATYLDEESLPLPSSIGVISDPHMSGAKVQGYREERARSLHHIHGRIE